MRPHNYFIGDDTLVLSLEEGRLDNWNLLGNPLNGWKIDSASSPAGAVFPRYRGAFEEGEQAPGRIRVGALLLEGGVGEGGASVRFRAPSNIVGSRREFGTSVELDPAVWTRAAQRKGWYIFIAAPSAAGAGQSARTVLLGLWSSLPATWLAQGTNGKPLPPPWRELWTFGSDHVWACRFTESPSDTSDIEEFLESCQSSTPPVPPKRAGGWHHTEYFPGREQ